MKTEILKAIELIDVDPCDFDHNYDWSRRTYAKCTKYVESENYNIKVEFEEEVKWQATDYYERIGITITELKIIDENGTEHDTDIKDNEIINQINY